MSVVVRVRKMSGGRGDDAVDRYDDANGELHGYRLMDNGAIRVRAFTPSNDPGKLGKSRLVKAYGPDGYLEVSGTVFVNDMCTTEEELRSIVGFGCDVGD